MAEYYDRLVRDHEDFGVKLDYMVNNPVKAGLVQTPPEWDAVWLNEMFGG